MYLVTIINDNEEIKINDRRIAQKTEEYEKLLKIQKKTS